MADFSKNRLPGDEKNFTSCAKANVRKKGQKTVHDFFAYPRKWAIFGGFFKPSFFLRFRKNGDFQFSAT